MSRLQTFLYDEQKAARRLRVASVCMQCDLDPGANRAKMVDTVDAMPRC
jgi:hypothetical protein